MPIAAANGEPLAAIPTTHLPAHLRTPPVRSQESQEERDLASITDVIEVLRKRPLAERQGRRGQRLGD